LDEVGILILDDDKATQSALQQMLDSEGWRVEGVSTANEALAALASGTWKLVIANVMMSGFDTTLFAMLSELGNAPAALGGNPPLRVLFLLPPNAGPEAKKALERESLTYALKPFHLHDFLDKISDLLLEIGAIPLPIRRVRHDTQFAETKPLKDTRRGRDGSGQAGRRTSMFASREDYMMTEEEIAEFERKEEEERKKKEKKKLERPDDL
jgi:CheY-like chemotaxis protein